MKSYLMIMAMALCLAGAPVAEAIAGEGGNTVMPVKKTKKSNKSGKSSAKGSAATPGNTVKNDEAAETKAENAAAGKQSSSGGGLESLIGGLLGGTSGSSSDSKTTTGSSVLSSLTSIFDLSKIASKNQIVGTWKYKEPAVVFDSDNALKNIGGKVVSAKIEKQLQQQFDKYGIKEGMMTMTFDKDGNFTQSLNGKTVSGTYTVSNKNVTLKYGGKVQQVVGTTQIDGNSLLIVMDASKLLKYASVVGSLTGNSLVKSASGLLSSVDGMELGMRLEK